MDLHHRYGRAIVDSDIPPAEVQAWLLCNLCFDQQLSETEEAEECRRSYCPVCCALRVLSVLATVSSGLCIRRSTVTVIGRRALGGLPLVALCLWTPSITRFNMGSEDWSRGGGSSGESCMLCTADKYDLMVWGARQSLARAVAK